MSTERDVTARQELESRLTERVVEDLQREMERLKGELKDRRGLQVAP